MSILFPASFDYLQTVFFKVFIQKNEEGVLRGSQGKAEKMFFLQIIKFAFLGGILKEKNTIKQ